MLFLNGSINIVNSITIAVLFSLFFLSPVSAQESKEKDGKEYPVAGTTPWQRPEGAPFIEWVVNEKPWYEHSLTGIDRPYPRSLWFLDNQGYWYTPFNRPGILPPYDLRGWHKHNSLN